MAKAIVTIGYKDYVMDVEDAVTILGLLEKAERYETQYQKNSSNYTHHVYEQELTDNVKDLKIITDKAYRFAKLAGRPEKS